MNKLVVVGWIGDRRAYLNVSKEEAVRRFAEAYDEPVELTQPGFVQEFEFTDSFGVYDAWGI